MVGMASLTLGGLLREFPNLQFCFFEAGRSWLPWVMYTLDRTYGVEPQCARCEVPPSQLIKKSCFVAVEPDELPLDASDAAIGSDNFIIGSDYPHPPSTYPEHRGGDRGDGPGALDEDDKEKILGRNVGALFGIS